MLTCRRLAFAILAFSTAAAQAQPAVPAVPPLRATTAPGTAAPASRVTPPAPVQDPDAPPTTDAVLGVTAGVPQTTAGPAATTTMAATADAPPTTDAAPTSAPATIATATRPATAVPTTDTPPTSVPVTAVASAAPNAAPAAPGAPSAPVLPPTVPRDYPTTPEGNARFLAEYAARPDVKKLDDGVLYRVLQAADVKSNGPIARGDTVTVSYRGWLIDGTAFDQTKPGSPVQFTLNAVVPGWRAALMKMKVGDLWEVAIPADQGYGAEGRAGRIPPNQTLIFVISLAKVEYAG